MQAMRGESREAPDVHRFGHTLRRHEQPLDRRHVRQRETYRRGDERPRELRMGPLPGVVPEKRRGGADDQPDDESGDIRFGVASARADDHGHDLAGSLTLRRHDRLTNSLLLRGREVSLRVHPSPAPRRSAAAETAAATAEASSATAASTPAAAAEKWAAIVAAASAGAPETAAAAAAQRGEQKISKEEQRQNQSDGKTGITRSLAPLRFGQRLALRDFHHRGDAGFDAAGEIAVFETRRDLLLDNAVGDRVGQHAFESVADFDAQLAVFRRDDEDGAVIEAFFADLPLLGDFDAEA